MYAAFPAFLQATLQANEAAVLLLHREQAPALFDGVLPVFPLTVQEQEKVARFRDPVQRDLYVLGRKCARGLIARVLMERGQPAPNAIPWMPDTKGRPGCPLAGAPDVNLSHTGEWLAVGWVPSGRVGVDLEHTTRTVAMERVAGRCFHARELDAVGGMHAEGFFRLWTRKEAWSKATGLGIAGADLRQVDTFALEDSGAWCFSEWCPIAGLQLCVVARCRARLFYLS